MNVFYRISISIMVGLVGTSLFAAPASFVYQGQIIRPDGLSLESNSVAFTIEVVSPGSEQCLLYREDHTLNMTGSNGVFSLEVGDGSRFASANFEDTSTLADALNNSAGTLTGLTCNSGTTYTPALTDSRKLRVTFDDGSGPTTLAQDHKIVSVPFAQSASSINGISAADLLVQRDDPGNYVLNQANLENIFSDSNYTELLALLAGTSSSYLSSLPEADFNMNTNKIVNLDDPTDSGDATNKNYVDSNIGGAGADTATISTLTLVEAGQVLTWDGNQWTSSAPSGDSTKLPLDGSVAMSGSLNMGTQNITNATDITLLNDLTVGNDVLVTGGIGVSVGINSDGPIGLNAQSQLQFRDTDDSNYLAFQAPVNVTADTLWTLPDGDGTSGQVLSTNGAGQLAWVDDNAPVTTVFGRDGVVVATAGDYNAGLITNTPAGDIAATDVQAAINELDADKVNRVGDTMTGNLRLASREIQLGDADDSNYVGFVAPAIVGADQVWVLPNADGISGQVLQTDGAGALSWVNQTTPASVDSVFGRTGVVVATAGDYNAGLITNTPAGDIAGTDVQAAINELDADKVNRAGDTMTGPLFIDGGADQVQFAIEGDAAQAANLVEIRNSASTLLASISSDGTVSAATDLTTKNYVDSAISGLSTDSIEDADGNTMIQVEETANDDTIRFDTAGVERMIINPTGNIGIAQPTPETKLDIDGTIKIADGGETCTVGTNAGMIRYNSGNLDYCNGSAWTTLGVSGAGLTSLGGQTGSTQSFAAGAAGTAPAIASAGDTHTLNVPLASGVGVTSGTISKTDYDNFNNKLDSIVGETLNSAEFWVGSAGNVAAAVVMSGDATMSNTGALTIAADAVTSAKILDGTIADADINASAGINASKLAAGSVDNTEFGYLDGVTSSIQTQLDGKEDSLGYTPVDRAGDTMTGPLFIDGGADQVQFAIEGDAAQAANLVEIRNSASTLLASISSNGTVSAATDLTTKSYVDSAISGLSTDSIEDADGNTMIQVEETANDDTIRFDTAGSERMLIDASGNVGIGISTPDKPLSPESKLEVDGAIRNTASVTNATSTIDFATGNLQFTTSSCGAFTLNNLKDGGVYNFAVKGTTSATCSFTAYSGPGTGALTVHMPAGHGATVAGEHTVYSIMVMGGDAYVAWVNEFN